MLKYIQGPLDFTEKTCWRFLNNTITTGNVILETIGSMLTLISWGSIRYPYGNPIQGPLLSVISDAFQPLTYWDDFQTDKNGVIFDNHYYSIFSNAEVARSWNQHIEFACARASVLTASNHKVLVGEWSLASTDCAKYLNGRGVGARYDGSYPGSTIIGTCGPFTGSGSGFSEEYKVFLRQFWEAQVTGEQPLGREVSNIIEYFYYSIWEELWMDILDLESWKCRWMELFWRSETRLDPSRSKPTTLPQYLRMKTDIIQFNSLILLLFLHQMLLIFPEAVESLTWDGLHVD